ncbi:hypothetical protein D3C76_890730 [compost metagenome]
MPRPAPDPLAEQRVEDRADAQRQPLVEGEQRQRQGDDGVDRPGVQAPVEDGGSHAQADGRLGIAGGRAQRRPVAARTILANADAAHGRGEMRHGFGHPIEHQADAHAGGEQHGEPAGIRIVRPRFLAAQAHPAQGRDDQAQAEQDEDVRRAEEEPRQIAGQPAAHGGEQRLDLALQGQGQDHEQDDGQRGNAEHLAMDIQVEEKASLDVVLADHVVGVDQVGRAARRGDAIRARGRSRSP